MNITSEMIDLFDRYLKNQMGPEEKQGFENTLAHDPEWLSEFEEHKALRELIQLGNMKFQLDQIDRKLSSSGSKRRTVPWRYAAAAVILLLLGFGGYQMFLQPKEIDLYSAFYNPDPGLPTTMGGEGQTLFSEAMIDFKLGDYRAALSRMQRINERVLGDTLLFYLGQAYLGDKQYERAVPVFHRIVLLDRSSYRKKAQWYLALGNLKIGNRKETINGVESMLKDPDHPFYREAKVLKAKLGE